VAGRIKSKAVRIFVIAEVLLCFVPLAGMVCLGILFAPFAVLDMLKGHFKSMMSVVFVALGIAGLIALVQVLKWLFGRQTVLLGRWWTIGLMLLGLLPVAVIFHDAIFDPMQHRFMVLVGAAPILVTAHLAYLARQYLFTSPLTLVQANNSLQSDRER
jgi:hypothetical protein